MSSTDTSVPTPSDPTVLDDFEDDLTAEDSLFDALEAAVIDPVPAGVSKYLASQLGYFSAKNTNKRTVDTAKLPASLLLVNRPTAQKLTGTDLERAVAKEFAKMVVTFAASRHLASSTAIAGSNVTFRLATPRPK